MLSVAKGELNTSSRAYGYCTPIEARPGLLMYRAKRALTTLPDNDVNSTTSTQRGTECTLVQLTQERMRISKCLFRSGDISTVWLKLVYRKLVLSLKYKVSFKRNLQFCVFGYFPEGGSVPSRDRFRLTFS